MRGASEPLTKADSQARNGTLNTHHLIKLLALVIMTIDHIGEFLYPDMLWWRAIGRVTFPVWFFLVGHALHYRIHRDTVLWALVLALLNPLLGNSFFPTNALVTILGCQWLLGQVEKRQWLAREPWTLMLAAPVFLLPSYALMEYGTLGFLYALMGYAVRSGQMDWRRGKAVAVLAWAMFLLMTHTSFAFDDAQFAWVVAGTTAVTLYLARFRHRPILGVEAMKPWAAGMVFFSRHSLQYYVIHRVLLQAAGVLTGALNPALRWF